MAFSETGSDPFRRGIARCGRSLKRAMPQTEDAADDITLRS